MAQVMFLERVLDIKKNNNNNNSGGGSSSNGDNKQLKLENFIIEYTNS